ncbi:molybdopterin molybdenumtransferase MoeA [Erythrobacter sp. Dej080120_24]|uniref:molybdopterin molybdotransferase MoeA n=1 Tax=unclassified Erythrobacter TaxID=2633097 RepID=UPI002923F68C|nr:molybdopterin molybdenumtransferase MoeA [Erythrobacter sp. Dej080120_24]
MSALLTLEEAQARLLALAPALPPTTVDIAPTLANRYLASDLKALRTQPPADLSAMDGYAIAGEGPWERVGESRAGGPFNGTLAPGQCTRISTGAHVPDGADRILIQENAEIAGTSVALAPGEAVPTTGRHVRKAGFDFTAGDMVLTVGTQLTPGAIALAIAAGHVRVPVITPPRVAVLDSGDELVPLGAEARADQIPASNGVMIASMLQPLVGASTALGPVADDPAALAEALGKAEGHDILITTGGASVGDHDLIQQALKDWGADLAFWKVAIKPGKPLMVATRGDTVVLGLPGNPVSSFVTAFLFALPLVRKAMGAAAPLPRASQAVCAEALPATGSRREFLRGVCEGGKVRLAASQDSSALFALAQANCLIDRPAGSPETKPGTSVPVYNLQNG